VNSPIHLFRAFTLFCRGFAAMSNRLVYGHLSGAGPMLSAILVEVSPASGVVVVRISSRPVHVLRPLATSM